MSKVGSRKRPAPGASPIVPQQPSPAVNGGKGSPRQAADQYLQWPQQNTVNSTPNYADPAANFAGNMYQGMLDDQAGSAAPSNQLTRRSIGQHLIPRVTYNQTGDDAWPVNTEDSLQPSQEQTWIGSIDDLEQKAKIAKRDTQAKRKQIPPFVQKLSSFLDESRNTELIRWSESGDSFIVADEDEFAKTLIPELFKHNNYASFVRQLNMYGFHKKVGLSDNSMRASERKNKSPSEYYNSYFKRGRPSLLWLIQKPKNAHGKGSGKGGARTRQDDGNMDDDADDVYEGDAPTPVNQPLPDHAPSLRNNRQPLMLGQAGGTLPQEELANFQRELQAVRHQQQVISSLLNQTRKEHQKLYGQAATFQSLHDRHESSINAILTFLATVYNRSLEGQGGPNFANMFAGAIPQDSQGQGNVVDVGDYGDQAQDPNGQPQRPFRKQTLLLKAPPSHSPQIGRATTASPGSSADSPLLRPSSQLSTQTQRCSQSMCSQVAPSTTMQATSDDTILKRSSESPQMKSDVNLSDSQIPESDILSMINASNASNVSFPATQRMDFPQALSHLQHAEGKSPLTPNQRQDVLQLMSNGSPNSFLNNNNNNNNNNNSFTFPSPPRGPNMSQYNFTKDQIEFLSTSVKDQGRKVDELTNVLAPLSPNGSIPGMYDTQNYTGTDMLDMDQIFNSGDYFNDGLTGGGAANSAESELDFINGVEMGDFNFEISSPDNGLGTGDDGFLTEYEYPNAGVEGNVGADGQAGRIVETVNSSEATSPANTVDEGGGVVEARVTSSGKKRQRTVG